MFFTLTIQPDLNEERPYAVVWFIYNSYGEEFAICSSGKMNNKYYILEKNTFEGLSLKLPTAQFDESVLECDELGAEPFTYNTIEEANKHSTENCVIVLGW